MREDSSGRAVSAGGCLVLLSSRAPGEQGRQRGARCVARIAKVFLGQAGS